MGSHDIKLSDFVSGLETAWISRCFARLFVVSIICHLYGEWRCLYIIVSRAGIL